MKESGGGSGQSAYRLWLLAQFTEQYREDERTSVVVRAIAFGEIRNAEDSVLEDAGGVGHARKVTELHRGQYARLPIERLGGKEFARARGNFQPGTLEGAHIHLRHIAPDHIAADPVSVLANGVPAGVIPQQSHHLM